MNIENKIKRNIRISYIYSFMLEFNITSAIWVLYLSNMGMSLVEIGLLESIFHITGLLFELPTGAIADIYGKKFTVVLGRLMGVVSCLLMIVSNSFWHFAVAFIIHAASYNLNSGSAQALVYDSLKLLKKEEEYKRLWGNLAFLMSIAQGIAILLGGILADIRFIYAYILGAVIQIAALLAATAYTEPPVQREKTTDNTVATQLKISLKVLRAKRIVLYLILFSALISSLGTTVYFYSQKYFEDMSYTKTGIAIIFAVSSLMSAFSSKIAHKLEKLLKPAGSLIAISTMNIMALFGLVIMKDLSILFFMLTSITGGLAYPIFSDYINSRIPSEYRATILSFDSLCFSLFMIVVFPLFGVMAQKIGFSKTFGGIAVLYIPVMIFLMMKLRKHDDARGIKRI